MFQAIEKLQREKEKLTTEFKENRTEYKSELKRINTAIKRFSQGYEALGSNLSKMPYKRGMATEIERILVNGAMTIKQIVAELSVRGFSSVKYQSVSAVLQINAKAGKRFFKVAPATYALIRVQTPTEEVQVEQKVESDEMLSDEFLSDDAYDF
jgi:thiamine biosynthesis lipoprotein ApbE